MRKHGEATKASIAWLLSFVSLYSLRGFHWLLSRILASLYAALPLGDAVAYCTPAVRLAAVSALASEASLY